MNELPKIASPRPYSRRQPVARFFKIGSMKVNGIQRTLWGFMSFYNGLGKPPTFGAFGGLAPVDDFGNLAMQELSEGDIIVAPGIIYKPIPLMDVTGKMMAEHERAMKTWRPRPQIVTEKDDAPAVDLGVIHMPGSEILQ